MDSIERKSAFRQSLKIVKETIAGNKELRDNFQHDIARGFYLAYKADGGKKYKTLKEIAVIADDAADNFLTLWCKE